MTVVVSSFPDVVDALLSKIRGLAAVTGAVPPVTVYDGFSGPNVPDVFVQVGGEAEPTADGAQDWAVLGDFDRDERYVVNCYVFAFVGGSDDSGTSGAGDAQKTARDRAFVIVHAIETALRSDPTLANGGTALVTWCGFGNPHFTVEQSDETDPDLAKGRKCRVAFGVEIYKRLNTV